MKKMILALVCGLSASLLPAQNQHVTFRSKMTFSGQTVANVWGYTANGREYALIGASKGLIIADITNPDAPQQIVQITGPNNLWKEVKTFRHYAYVVSEGGQGLQIVNLSNLPSANLASRFYTGDGAIQGQLGKIHALHVDTTKGFLYAYGGNLFNGGAKVFDLNGDPYNPRYVGKFDQLGYIHDGYVDNDTLYGSHIYQGLFSIVNMADKANPQLIATQTTPNNFTHNTWISTDRRTIFTTDETANSFLAAYDVSNPGNIKLLDKIQSNPGSNSAVHNTHILGNFAITAWYKDGFTIVDVSRPGNLVQVGQYDTYPAASGSGYDGCWGVYPYFPSGTLIASTITLPGANTGELWIMTPEYVRACFLEGKIVNGQTGNPLNGALVEVVGGVQSTTGSDGVFRTGQVADGYAVVNVSKAGYQTQQFTVLLQHGEVVQLDVPLYPDGGLSVGGQVVSGPGNTPVAGASVSFLGQSGSRQTVTDANGNFTLTSLPPGLYTVGATAPGVGKVTLFKQKVFNNQVFTLKLTGLGHLFDGDQNGDVLEITAGPNPFSDQFELFFPAGFSADQLFVFTPEGKIIEQLRLPVGSSAVRLGQSWPAGVYLIRVEQNGQLRQTLKAVKF